jgi:hypothetical protein
VSKKLVSFHPSSFCGIRQIMEPATAVLLAVMPYADAPPLAVFVPGNSADPALTAGLTAAPILVILLGGDGAEVFRIYTTPVMATVIELQAIRDRPPCGFVCEPMRYNRLTRCRHPKLSVSPGKERAGPVPASISLINS